MFDLHLDGSSIAQHSGPDVETLRLVAIRVDLHEGRRRRRGRSHRAQRPHLVGIVRSARPRLRLVTVGKDAVREVQALP